MAVFVGTISTDDFVGSNGVFDRVIYNSNADTVLDLVTSANSTGKAANDTFVSIEGYNFAGTGNHTFVGTSSNQVVTGGNGNDTIDGGGGKDSLRAGSGNDTFRFGAGYDVVDSVYNGGNGTDTVLIVDNGMPVTLDNSVLVEVERIAFETSGSTLVVGEPSYFSLIDGSATDDDTVVISNFADGQDPLSVYFDLIDSGIETVKVIREDQFEFTATSAGVGLIDVRTDDISPTGNGSSIQYSIKTYDTDLDLRALEQKNDDGRLTNSIYDENGVIVSISSEDTDDNFGYTTSFTMYVDGIRNQTVTVNDNGVIVTSDFDALGDKQTITHDDLSDAFNYSTIVDTFYSAADGGRRAERTTTYDEGESAFAETTLSYNQNGSLSFRELVFQNGRITQVGYDNDDILSGGAQNDNFAGGGGNDTFLFNGPAIGIDGISDFDDTGNDILDLTAYGITSRDDIEMSEFSSIEQAGTSVKITLDDVGIIILRNTDLSAITNDDFADLLIG